MNWPLMIVAMLPEHLLLAGIAVLIGLNIMQVGERHSGLWPSPRWRLRR